MFRRALLLLICLLPVLVSATEVRATLDRNKVALGDTVTLNLQVEGGGMFGTPDLSALANDFAVLGTSNNTSLSIVNGKRSAQLTFGVALRPLHTGKLTIPSISFAGGSTQPITLEVSPADNSPIADGRKDVYVETTLDPQQAWVGEQVLFTVRLYLAAPLANGSLDDPRVQGVELAKISDDLNYQQEKGGKRYSVIERRYALIPQKAGKLEIPPIAFSGELVEMADPDSFFGSTRTASAISQSSTLEVKAVPADAGTTAWLPARELSLSLEGADGQVPVRVGQSLSLTMTVQATGLPYEALPSPSLPNIDGATVYPDKPVNGTRVVDTWLQGRRQQTFALVPSRAGKLEIPATTLTWFNVRTGKTEVARIPARTLEVLPAVGTAASTSPATAAAPSVEPQAATATATAPARWSVRVLIGAAVLLLALGGVTGFLLSRRRASPSLPKAQRTAKPVAPVGARALRAAFFAAARAGDTEAQCTTLLNWARHERAGLHNLGELAAQLSADEQRNCIEALQRARYGATDAALPGSRLEAAFRHGFAWKPADGRGEEAVLAPLYPFNTD